MAPVTSIDAVLPLTLKDAPRAELLLQSLAQNFSGLRRLWVVCPDSQSTELAAQFAQRQLSFELVVEPELRVVPEFALPLRQSGWFRQQMIKLAIYERMQSEIYLTLDADVVCARPVSAEQLTSGAKAACHLFPGNEFDYWYRRVESVLRVRAPHLGQVHNVTPALLHRSAVAELRASIESNIARKRFSRGWRGWKQRWHLRGIARRPDYAAWRVFLMAARPWTEYALYYTFLETSGLFDRYHFYSPYCIYDHERSLWHAANGEMPPGWDPHAAFEGSGPPWFLVAQSNTGISPEAIRDKLLPLLERRKSER